MAAKTVLLLAGQVDESNIRHMCIMGKDVLEVITYKRERAVRLSEQSAARLKVWNYHLATLVVIIMSVANTEPATPADKIKYRIYNLYNLIHENVQNVQDPTRVQSPVTKMGAPIAAKPALTLRGQKRALPPTLTPRNHEERPKSSLATKRVCRRAIHGGIDLDTTQIESGRRYAGGIGNGGSNKSGISLPIGTDENISFLVRMPT
ncbi:hypothetical protein BGZ61DRAFT_486077 [Ilyonectria robusta]|uniref:uncharacterized protein n=1 Tax=Ilyonectria robusta TaxID=1079257 RepID=UPI001E8CB754|nr:uncharacterized protein BGZ61DRAFT_486077 [Ilyonectria robusta]KAH8658890.1 hypothetical protein BGZ61DRAFT_486077 [Ilyonectria robusta]